MGLFTTGRHAKTNRLARIAAIIGSLALTATAVTALQSPAQAVTQTYGFTGGPQIYVVPDAVTSINVSLSGAQGGSPTGGGTGGKGANLTSVIAVNPGEVLMIMVGGNGTTNGGWNGGGRGAGTGGGATDIRRQSGAFNTSSSCAYTLTCAVSDRIVVAGGGGGGGAATGTPATANGGDAGQSGSAGSASNVGLGDATAGGGATPSAGGSAGTGSFTSSGQGAAAGSSATGATSAWVAQATGGGGGGGYFGGGSGGVSQDNGSTPAADGAGGGGGGSSWAGAAGVSAAVFNSGANIGDGSVTIDPPSAIPTAAFAFTGAEQFYTVPANTSQLYVRIYGAGGGLGAPGDIVYGRIPATPGQVLQVNIGGRGYGDATYYPGHSNGDGGWNGGGQGYVGPGWGGGGGGGGASDIRLCAGADPTHPCTLGDRKVVAGGGGGGSYPAWGLGGGHGGEAVYGAGQNGYGGAFGYGGSLTAGGATANQSTATMGSLGIGGASGQPFYGGGGGGGGLYGGGGGDGSGGGGGSSCASVTTACDATSNVLGLSSASVGHSRGFGSLGDGMAVITAMPEASTGAVSNVTSTTASVSGAINAKFLASTPKLFIGTNQSAIDSCASVSAPCTPSTTVLRSASMATTLAGTSTQSVSGSITGLSANTTYYYRVCAQSVAGYSCGGTSTFSTQLSITNSSLANGTVGQAYTDQLSASGGSGSYASWALANASTLPAGLSLNPITGAITGTPTAVANGSVDLTVTDSLSASVTKSLSFAIAAAPVVQSQTPSNASPAMPSIPLVSGISPRTATTTSGGTVTFTGTNLAGSTITIGGVAVVVTANSATSVTFTVPAGLAGTVAVVITNSSGRLNLVNALTVTTPQSTPTQPQRSLSDVTVFDNFAPGSAALTPSHIGKLRATLRLAAGMKTMVCTGFTMGPKVLKADQALAKSRAQAVCGALHKLAPRLQIVQSTGVTETGVGGAVRRAEVYFKG